MIIFSILQWFEKIIMFIFTIGFVIFTIGYGLYYDLSLKQLDGNYYTNSSDEVYFQSDFEGAKFYTKMEGVSSDKFKIIQCTSVTYCYGTQDNKLYYNNHYIKDADPDSFELLEDWWYAKDNKSVFYLAGAKSKKLDGVNPNEFIDIGNGYRKYKDICYQHGNITDCPSNTNF